MRANPSYIKRAGSTVGSAVFTVAAALAICLLLVRFAPGFEVDTRELDARLNSSSVEGLRAARVRSSLWDSLKSFGTRVLAGDLGTSEALQQPIQALIRERVAVTAKPLFAGILLGWTAALLVSILNQVFGPTAAAITCSMSSWILCVPAPVMALALMTRSASPDSACYWVGGVVSLIVFSRVLLLTDRILTRAASAQYVEYARSKGLSDARIFFAHVLWPAAPTLLAVAGSSVGIALGGVMPLEVVCDLPGIGQLAWLATQQRDLPLLLTVTFLVTVTAIIASSVGDLSRVERMPA
jgi:peptide/nickel transport system permease protein